MLSEQVTQLLLAILGAGGLSGGIGWWFKTRREDHLARELAHKQQIKDLQQEVKELLQDRIRYEIVRRESSDQTMRLLSELVSLMKQGKGTLP